MFYKFCQISYVFSKTLFRLKVLLKITTKQTLINLKNCLTYPSLAACQYIVCFSWWLFVLQVFGNITAEVGSVWSYLKCCQYSFVLTCFSKKLVHKPWISHFVCIYLEQFPRLVGFYTDFVLSFHFLKRISFINFFLYLEKIYTVIY